MSEIYPYWVEVTKDPEPNSDFSLCASKGMFGLIIRAWAGDPNYVMRSCLWVHKDRIQPLIIGRDRHDDRTWCDRLAENQENLFKYLKVID